MKIKDAQIEATAAGPAQYPEDNLPEAAFAGRSNVGKSAMINTLVRRKKLAYVGSTPGKTRLINFYRINDELRLVDLPGYGYAKVPGNERRSWADLAGDYLSKRENLKVIVFLIDIRHKPSSLDIEMAKWLSDNGKPFVLCITKSDKISKSRQKKNIMEIIRGLEPQGDTPLVVFSSQTREGREELWEAICHYTGIGRED